MSFRFYVTFKVTRNHVAYVTDETKPWGLVSSVTQARNHEVTIVSVLARVVYYYLIGIVKNGILSMIMRIQS